jgi:hypothetical protein
MNIEPRIKPNSKRKTKNKPRTARRRQRQNEERNKVREIRLSANSLLQNSCKALVVSLLPFELNDRCSEEAAYAFWSMCNGIAFAALQPSTTANHVCDPIKGGNANEVTPIVNGASSLNI